MSPISAAAHTRPRIRGAYPARAPGAVALATLLLAPAAMRAQKPAAAPPAWAAATDSAIGKPGAVLPGGVVKYGFPRSDLSVQVGDVTLRPSLALGSWLAIQGSARHAMAMGDLVLLEDEVAPVMRALEEGGVEVSAVHNHLLHESPRVMYVHLMATGAPVAIARTVRGALAHTATPIGASGAPGLATPAIAFPFDSAAVARSLGVHGAMNGGVYQVSVPRRERVRMHGRTVPPSMGVATAINFQPMAGDAAVATGDFVMVASEVNRVIRALQAHGITVAALHSHMLDEEPRLFFMHFWASGKAVDVAAGLAAALDQMNVVRTR